eukprot:scaffold4903_cov157-Skeletonema_marinoi.AAC.5
MQHQAVARTHHSTATITFRSYYDYEAYLLLMKEDHGRRLSRQSPGVGGYRNIMSRCVHHLTAASVHRHQSGHSQSQSRMACFLGGRKGVMHVAASAMSAEERAEAKLLVFHCRTKENMNKRVRATKG